MRIGEVKQLLGLLPEEPKLLIGPPGIGKTQVVKQWAEERRMRYCCIPLAHFRPEDLSGIPFVKPDGAFGVARPSLIPDENEASVIFFDEITCVSSDIIAIALKAVDEKILGWHKFTHSYIVAAGNPPEWGGSSLDERLISRFLVFNVEANVDDIVSYFASKYVGCNGLAFVSSFLYRNPSFLLKRGREGEAFPTPREWEKVLKLMNTIDLDDKAIEYVGSAIGQECAATFVKFCKIVNVMEITDKVLQGKAVSFSTEKLDVAYLITTSLSTRTQDEKQAEYCLRFIQHQLVKGEIPKDLVLLYLRLLVPKKLNLEKIANLIPTEIWLQVGKLMNIK
jgi:hypothetical protein